MKLSFCFWFAGKKLSKLAHDPDSGSEKGVESVSVSEAGGVSTLRISDTTESVFDCTRFGVQEKRKRTKEMCATRRDFAMNIKCLSSVLKWLL